MWFYELLFNRALSYNWFELICAVRLLLQTEMIVHELGHLVGLWHEHARYDRDSHVIVQFNNIKELQEHNFNKQKSMRLLAPYDLSSIMHYGLKVSKMLLLLDLCG